MVNILSWEINSIICKKQFDRQLSFMSYMEWDQLYWPRFPNNTCKTHISTIFRQTIPEKCSHIISIYYPPNTGVFISCMYRRSAERCMCLFKNKNNNKKQQDLTITEFSWVKDAWVSVWGLSAESLLLLTSRGVPAESTQRDTYINRTHRLFWLGHKKQNESYISSQNSNKDIFLPLMWT